MVLEVQLELEQRKLEPGLELLPVELEMQPELELVLEVLLPELNVRMELELQQRLKLVLEMLPSELNVGMELELLLRRMEVWLDPRDWSWYHQS